MGPTTTFIAPAKKVVALHPESVVGTLTSAMGWLATRVSEHAHDVMSEEQVLVKAHLKSNVVQSKMLDPKNMFVSAMLTSRESPTNHVLHICVARSNGKAKVEPELEGVERATFLF